MITSRNLIANGRRTSIRLEPEFWDAMAGICEHEHICMRDLVNQVVASRKQDQGLTAAIRVFVLVHYIARVA